jgi:hypothetical protein
MVHYCFITRCINSIALLSSITFKFNGEEIQLPINNGIALVYFDSLVFFIKMLNIVVYLTSYYRYWLFFNIMMRKELYNVFLNKLPIISRGK